MDQTRRKPFPLKYNDPFDAKLEYLREEQIQSFLDYSWRMRTIYVWLNGSFVIVGLSLAGAVTISGLIGQPPLPGILGAAVTVLLGIQNAFRFARRANVWEMKHGEAKTIRDCLRYQVTNEEEFHKAVDRWIAFREGLLQSLPGIRGLDDLAETRSLIASGRSGGATA